MSAFSDAVLCAEDDLRAQESRMPDAAKAVRAPNGATAADGKITLAKEAAEKWLRRHGIHPDGVITPAQLQRAAVYMTLALMFRDMGSRNDSVSWDKAKFYTAQFEEEMSSLELDYDSSLVPQQPARAGGVNSIPLYRA